MYKIEIYTLQQKPEYLDQVAEWLYLEWGIKTADSTLLTVLEKLETFKNIDKISINYVAFKGEKLVSTFNLMLSDPPARKDLSPWLGSLYVAPDYERKRGPLSGLLGFWRPLRNGSCFASCII